MSVGVEEDISYQEPSPKRSSVHFVNKLHIFITPEDWLDDSIKELLS